MARGSGTGGFEARSGSGRRVLESKEFEQFQFHFMMKENSF